MGCWEKEVSREEGLKRKRCQKIGMPRERDVNGQRLKRHGCPETAMTSEKHCQKRRVSGLGLHGNTKGCQNSEMPLKLSSPACKGSTCIPIKLENSVQKNAYSPLGCCVYLCLFFRPLLCLQLPQPRTEDFNFLICTFAIYRECLRCEKKKNVSCGLPEPENVLQQFRSDSWWGWLMCNFFPVFLNVLPQI